MVAVEAVGPDIWDKWQVESFVLESGGHPLFPSTLLSQCLHKAKKKKKEKSIQSFREVSFVFEDVSWEGNKNLFFYKPGKRFCSVI